MSQDQNAERFVERLEGALARLAGPKDMRREREYSGRPHTYNGFRGSQMVEGVTMRDLQDCMIRGYILSHFTYKNDSMEPLEPNATLVHEAMKGPYAQLNANDMFELVGDVDPVAVIQNTLCEVEKILGIFPNVGTLSYKGKVLLEKKRLIQTRTHVYIADSGEIIQRENGVMIPGSLELYDRWVLRRNTTYVDSDAYLNDLIERNNFSLDYANPG